MAWRKWFAMKGFKAYSLIVKMLILPASGNGNRNSKIKNNGNKDNDNDNVSYSLNS